ncbi:hypothetical protein [Methylobacterium haplocladii]|uniref:HTH merR-type domain-containing protein n=1 Tax=Methylobacterium haplocladii TaxID=1176176 RepID=A0A512IP92_9HYPH|nr:hypothetical protein [Methylobacterium haplocladii]GEO99515.1 hypothetical protein MHA02_19030 [Methylobacterium haplocladii]GJD83658.1 hypothetical protein HPGCJGGD_1528 [Methylobacterium haplocladii]GLS59746.1 hypothetical protein GCM10007887_24180 [Methylobacterium haplocladii]
MTTFTVGQMAERLSVAKPSLSAAYIARQIRGWAQADLFPDAGVRGSGRTAAQIFEEHHLVMAQIYGFLTMLGMTGPQLKTVNACLQNGTRIKEVVKAYNTGDRDWRLFLYFTEDGEIWGGKLTKQKSYSEGVVASAPNVIMLAPRSLFRVLDVTDETEVPAPAEDDGE